MGVIFYWISHIPWIFLPNGKLQIVKTTFYTIYSDFCTIIINLKCITTLNKQKVKELARFVWRVWNSVGYFSLCWERERTAVCRSYECIMLVMQPYVEKKWCAGPFKWLWCELNSHITACLDELAVIWATLVCGLELLRLGIVRILQFENEACHAVYSLFQSAC